MRGFLLGAILTAIAAGGGFYYIYQEFESRVSPEAIQAAAAKNLTDSLGMPVEIGNAKLSFPNLLILERLHLTDQGETMVSVEKVEAFAEDGLAGVQKGRFARLVVTNPVISLERAEGNWNIETFLRPILSKLSTAPAPLLSDATATAGPAEGSALRLVEISGLQLSIALEDRNVYSGLEFEQITAHRPEGSDVWNIRAGSGKARLNPLEEEWPLLEVVEMAQSLVRKDTPTANIESPGEAVAPEAQESSTALAWVGDVTLEGFDLELISTGQTLSLGGLSFHGEDLFRSLQFQTGSLEKKNLNPRS
jgi:hypothetical protein